MRMAKPSNTPQRIGIYAGTFDPVHAGHIGFALQAAKAARLDRVYFLPERQPRHKHGVEHFGHRVAMLRRALAPHGSFGVLELPDVRFTVERTLRRLRTLFPEAEFVFLLGSDVAVSLSSWPQFDVLLARSEMLIGMREQDELRDIEAAIAGWPVHPSEIIILDSYAPGVSSRVIREALRRRQYVSGLLSSVRRYSEQHWLYVSLGHVRVDKA